MLLDDGFHVLHLVFGNDSRCAGLNRASPRLAEDIAEFAEYSAGKHKNAQHQLVFEDFDRSFFQNEEAGARITLLDD